jgi:iron complex outermembrane receptor protein
VALAAWLCATAATTSHAQAAPESTTTLQPVTVTGRSDTGTGIAGFSDAPLATAPFQARVIDDQQMREAGVQRLSDITRIDAAVSDAYNAEGYWDSLTVRGYVIDNRFNYRRDGLPINAETSIPLDNKERIELLKGTSGIQAGTSAPGGLVNMVVKRPTDAPLRHVSLGWRERGSLLGAVDLSQRFGDADRFGLRLNAAAEHLDPLTHDASGERNLLALAGDWRISPDTLLEAEFETSHRRQPSVPGFSLLGGRVPAPVDPRINLNNQPWSQPVVFGADTASLRWQQQLASDWRFVGQAAVQRLRTDDRLAYPFGCSKEGNYDRYCSDGTFDYYDFRSDNERRTTKTLAASVEGRIATGTLTHHVNAGVMSSRFDSRLQPRVDDATIVGTGSVDGLTMVPTLPALGTVANTNLTERSTELHLSDHLELAARTGLWLGLRHTRMHRDSVLTDGSEPTTYNQSFTTPWLALTQAISADTTVYASWGRGVESEVAPNRLRYTNRGQALPALKSRQAEIGLKTSGAHASFGVALFDIQRPVSSDVGADCFTDTPGNTCTHVADGTAHHRGIEANAEWRGGAWAWQGGVQWLHARREGSADTTLNGQRPTNVPTATLKLQGRYTVAAVSGLSLSAGLLAESRRAVLPDNSIHIPGYGRIDTALRYVQPTQAGTLTWRAGIDNLFDRRAWKESPYQFAHAYLFPLAPRTLRLSLDVAL